MSPIHANGLILPPLPGLDIEPTAEGYRLRPADFHDRRHPFELTVSLQPFPPAVRLPRRRTAAGRTVQYDLAQLDGGSGGPEQVLSLWAPRATGGLFIRQRVAADQADFSLAWQLAAEAEATGRPDL